MRISVLLAARIMEKSLAFVRIGLQRNLLPFGFSIQSDLKKKRCRRDYYINPKQFCDYLGISADQLKKYEDDFVKGRKEHVV